MVAPILRMLAAPLMRRASAMRLPVAAHALLLPLAVALALLPAVACAAPDPARVDAAIAGVLPEMTAWRRDIHQHPELGTLEVRTAAKVAGHLRGLGLEVRTGIRGTGVAAVLRGARPGPRIALRADMDALPVTEATGLPFASTVRTTYRSQEVGVMHACGHDAHVAILMAAAEALVALKGELAGEVMVICGASWSAAGRRTAPARGMASIRSRSRRRCSWRCRPSSPARSTPCARRWCCPRARSRPACASTSSPTRP